MNYLFSSFLSAPRNKMLYYYWYSIYPSAISLSKKKNHIILLPYLNIFAEVSCFRRYMARILHTPDLVLRLITQKEYLPLLSTDTWRFQLTLASILQKRQWLCYPVLFRILICTVRITTSLFLSWVRVCVCSICSRFLPGGELRHETILYIKKRVSHAFGYYPRPHTVITHVLLQSYPGAQNHSPPPSYTQKIYICCTRLAIIGSTTSHSRIAVIGVGGLWC